MKTSCCVLINCPPVTSVPVNQLYTPCVYPAQVSPVGGEEIHYTLLCVMSFYLFAICFTWSGQQNNDDSMAGDNYSNNHRWYNIFHLHCFVSCELAEHSPRTWSVKNKLMKDFSSPPFFFSPQDHSYRMIFAATTDVIICALNVSMQKYPRQRKTCRERERQRERDESTDDNDEYIRLGMPVIFNCYWNSLSFSKKKKRKLLEMWGEKNKLFVYSYWI